MNLTVGHLIAICVTFVVLAFAIIKAATSDDFSERIVWRCFLVVVGFLMFVLLIFAFAPVIEPVLSQKL